MLWGCDRGTGTRHKHRWGKILYEAGQVLVVSACDSREEFLARRDRIEAFVARMGEELNQDAVFVLAFDSDSFLIELGEGGS